MESWENEGKSIIECKKGKIFRLRRPTSNKKDPNQLYHVKNAARRAAKNFDRKILVSAKTNKITLGLGSDLFDSRTTAGGSMYDILDGFLRRL